MVKNIGRVLGLFVCLSTTLVAQQGIRDMTEPQRQALSQINSELAGPTKALNDARNEVIVASLTVPQTDAALKQRVDAVAAAEVVLAKARAQAFSRLQSSPDKLTAAQVTGLAGTWARTVPIGNAQKYNGTIPRIRASQTETITKMDSARTSLNRKLFDARRGVVDAVIAGGQDQAIQTAVESVRKTELDVALAHAHDFQKLQASKDKLDQEQVAALIDYGGSITVFHLVGPTPMDFNDHEGYVSLFDGTTLKGWEGKPGVWRAEDGAIVGISTPEKPVGNSYIWYRERQPKDFTLKLEIKIEGTGGSGIQYRSTVDQPWLQADIIPASVLPLNLHWMMTGPQADFWPTTSYSGMYYSENTPLRLEASRGQVVEGFGMSEKRLMANIGDRNTLGQLVKMNDWNQYTVIARGGTLMHILNGQLMAVMIDDDPASSNNQTGYIGIEIEQFVKISVRNIWLKQLR